MRKPSFYCIYILLLLSACLAEQTNPLIVASCIDGIQNQNEEDVDCGGICISCSELGPPIEVTCQSSLVNNQLVLDGISYNLTQSDFETYHEDEYVEISVVNPFFATIWIQGALPTKRAQYQIVENTDPLDLLPGEASVMVVRSQKGYYSSEGELYLTYANEEWKIMMCSVDMEDAYKYTSFELYGMLTCD